MLKVSNGAFEVIKNSNGKAFVAASNYHKGKVVEIAHEGFVGTNRDNTDFRTFFTNTLKWMSLGKNDSCEVHLNIDTALSAAIQNTARRWSTLANITSSFVTVNSSTRFETCDILLLSIYQDRTDEVVELILEFVRQGGGLIILGHNWARRSNKANDLTLPAGIEVTKTGLRQLNVNVSSPQPEDSIPFITQGVENVDFGDVIPSLVLTPGNESFPLFINEECTMQLVSGAHYSLGRVIVFGHENIFTEAVSSDLNDVNSTFNVLLNSILWLGRHRGCEVEYRSDALDELAQKMASNITMKRSNFNSSSCQSPLILDVSTVIEEDKIREIQDDVYNGKGLLIGGHVSDSNNWVNTLLEPFGLEMQPSIMSTSQSPQLDPTTDRLFLFHEVEYLSFNSRRPGVIHIKQRNAFGVGEGPNGEIIIAASNYGNGKVLVITHESVASPTGDNSFRPFLQNAYEWMSLGQSCSPGSKVRVMTDVKIRKGVRDTMKTWAKDIGYSGMDIDAESEDLGQCSVYVATVYHKYSVAATDKILNFIRQGGGVIAFGQNYHGKTCYANDFTLPTGIYITKRPLDRDFSADNISTATYSPSDSVPFITQGIASVSFGDEIPSSVIALANQSFEVFTNKDSISVTSGAHYGLGRVIVFGHESIFMEAVSSDPNDVNGTFNVLLNSILWLGRHRGCEVEYRSEALDELAQRMANNITMKRSNFNSSSCQSPLILDVSTVIEGDKIREIQDDVYNGKGLLIGGHVGDSNNWVNTLLEPFGLKVEQSYTFPGRVTSALPNTDVSTLSEKFTVQVDASYHTLPPHLQGQSIHVWRTTGIYAQMSQPVRIQVPSSMVGNQFKIQIGSHTDDLSNVTKLYRSEGLVSTFEITATSVAATSQFGGMIYIVVPPDSSLRVVDVVISGGYQAPILTLDQHGSTSFQNRSDRYRVPFSELRGQKVILTLPTDLVNGMDEPSKLIQIYDDVIGHYEHISENTGSNIEKTLIVLDVQTSTGKLHGGYPVVGLISDKTLTNLTAIESGEAWDALNILAGQFIPKKWNLPLLGEGLSDLFSVYASEKVLEGSVSPLLTTSARNARISQYMAGGKNYIGEWNGLTAAETYLQLRESFGWNMYEVLLPRSDTNAHQPCQSSSEDLSDLDKWVISTSKFSGYNLYDFYKTYWGLPVTSKAFDAVSDLPEWPYGPE